MPTLAPAIGLLLATAAFPQSQGASGAQEASETDIVATRTDAYDRMTVPVRIGTNGPFNFLIDTGSQNTVISNALATRLSLIASAKAKLIGIAGTQIVDTVEIEAVGLGSRNYYGLLAPILDYADIGADGIIGLDSLQGQRVLIDFQRNLIVIDEASKLGGNRDFDIVVTAQRRSGQLILTNGRVDGIRVDVVIDTGAGTTIGNRALQRALSRRKKTNRAVLHSVTGQQISADMVSARSLSFGEMSINDVTLAFADAPPFAYLGLDEKPAILLGMRELRGFKRVAIDFQTRKVLFDFTGPSRNVYLPADRQ